jgi:spermidine/putrescine transport system substrate-binding protein
MPFDPGNKFSVPYMAGTVGIVVNTDLVKAEIKSFRDVFQPANKGKIVVLDDAREIVSWALATKGIDVNQISEKNLKTVKPILEQWLPLVKVYDSDSPKTALLNGDVALGVIWGGEGAILLNKNKKFRWVIPTRERTLHRQPGNSQEVEKCRRRRGVHELRRCNRRSANESPKSSPL